IDREVPLAQTHEVPHDLWLADLGETRFDRTGRRPEVPLWIHLGNIQRPKRNARAPCGAALENGRLSKLKALGQVVHGSRAPTARAPSSLRGQSHLPAAGGATPPVSPLIDLRSGAMRCCFTECQSLPVSS